MPPWPLATAALLTCVTLAGANNGVPSLTFGDATPGFAGIELDSRAAHKPDCPRACAVLKSSILHGKVFARGTDGYRNESADYWSNLQAEQRPFCYVLPSTAKEVALALQVAESTYCPFAVKSGGHAAFKGASNIGHGFTIDLRKFNKVTVSEDRKTARVGPGNRWVDVYQALEPHKLTVIGGRVSAIGVGGLTLGGGISFFSGRQGWACDNVRNYEVVLPRGRILDVNTTSYPDLYFALRGGGNNFGIVTRFDMAAYQQGRMWGGGAIYLGAYNATLLHALANFAHAAPQYPDAAVFVAFAYAQGQFFASNEYTYAQPVADPPAFREFLAVQNLSSTTRVTSLANLTLELNKVNPTGLRESYNTATFTMDAKLMRDILAIFAEEVQSLADVDGYLPAVVFQAITKNEIVHFKKNGGNALGITEAEGPLMLLEFPVMWAKAADDERVIEANNRALRRSIELGKKRGLHNRYIYQNYATDGQQVFKGYGEANYKRLLKISKKYDPGRVFQDLQPGYFKL